MIGVIGRSIEGLDDFEKVCTILNALGVEHRGRKIIRENYDWIEVGLYKVINEVDGPHWDDTVKEAWRITYWIITEKMIKMNDYDHT